MAAPLPKPIEFESERWERVKARIFKLKKLESAFGFRMEGIVALVEEIDKMEKKFETTIQQILDHMERMEEKHDGGTKQETSGSGAGADAGAGIDGVADSPA